MTQEEGSTLGNLLCAPVFPTRLHLFHQGMLTAHSRCLNTRTLPPPAQCPCFLGLAHLPPYPVCQA